MRNDHPNAARELIECIVELRWCGLEPEEIAAQVFGTRPETALFRAGLLIEIILGQTAPVAEESVGWVQ